MSAEQGTLIDGLDQRPAAPTPPVFGSNGKQRLKRVDRKQTVLRQIDPERLIEADHPARAIWDLLNTEGLDLSRFYEGIEAIEGRAGRDHSDPKVLIALWLYAMSRGVREARELARWAKYEPGCQWLLGLQTINYHTLSDFVTEHAEALDQLFVDVVHVLMSEDLVGLERVAHDGTKVRAAASRKSFKREERLEECRRLAEEQVAALKQEPEKVSARQRAAGKRAARERAERVEQAQKELKRQQAAKKPAEQKQVRVSTTDRDARVMRTGEGGFAPCHNVQISTDARYGVILAYDVTAAGEDSQQLKPALEHIEANTGRMPDQTLVDGGYTTRENIMETAEKPTELIGSLGEDRSKSKLEHNGVKPEFFPERFQFDAENDRFICPAGKPLPYRDSKPLVGAIEKHYRAKPSDCKACSFRSQCCPKATKQGRLVIQVVEDPRVAEFREKMQKPEYRAIYKQRARVAEFSNACVKEKKGLRRFLRRGSKKVRAETAWACLSCNVSIWIRLKWKVSLRACT